MSTAADLNAQGTKISLTGHPLPRRSSPSNSVTLRHHKLARDASLRASPGSGTGDQSSLASPPRRNSSGGSYETGHSDPKKWFDHSNENPTATYDNDNAMDVDPPFFQRESDSSNEDKIYLYPALAAPPKLDSHGGSSAGDYRSVIDDLTVEIQKLKEELKRYKQDGPDMLRKDKLFEIKMHGLPNKKKRELEATLRDFAVSLNDTSVTTSSPRKKSRHPSRGHKFSGSGSLSKHASSSAGSNPRPVDSAYASMSIGAHSSVQALSRPSGSSRGRMSDQKVNNYLRDIPEGLYPKHLTISEREKKKLVVRRLEQLFTGKISGRHAPRNQHTPATSGIDNMAPVIAEATAQQRSAIHQPPPLAAEPAREAKILSSDLQANHGKKSRSRDNGSASNSHSNGDQTESGGNGNSSGSGANTSPPSQPPPEQRPTRPKDLDPDRIQVPSENMDYIRHLGLVPPKLLNSVDPTSLDVQPDADGWVYLNLLCNLAQLHIINVTPNFVLSSVSDYSAKFQISTDGRKIRWTGGDEGTKFSSDSSGDNSQRSPDEDDTDSSTKKNRRKRQKTGRSTGDEIQSGGSSKDPSKAGPQISASSESFHYKPMFAQQASPDGFSSMDETLSSFGPVEGSNEGESKWDLSGSGASNRKKRRHGGAIIYYSGAPFCTDLSGDQGDTSSSYAMSGGQDQAPLMQFARPLTLRSESGSLLSYKPLSDFVHNFKSEDKMDTDSSHATLPPSLITDCSDDETEVDMEFPWTNEQQYLETHALEPCGLGGVLPEDHFMVVVTTKRSKLDSEAAHARGERSVPEESTDSVIRRLAGMSTASPKAPASQNSSRSSSPALDIEYLSGRIKRLPPVALPPPAIFVPPFTSDSSMSDSDDLESEADTGGTSSSELMSRQANPHQSDGYPDGVDLTSGDEDGENPEDEPDSHDMYENEDDESSIANKQPQNLRRPSSSAVAAAGTIGARSKSASAERMLRTESSAAADGDSGVGYSSSDDNSN